MKKTLCYDLKINDAIALMIFHGVPHQLKCFRTKHIHKEVHHHTF